MKDKKKEPKPRKMNMYEIVGMEESGLFTDEYIAKLKKENQLGN